MSKSTPGPWEACPPYGNDPDAGGSKYHWTVRAPGGDRCISFQLAEISSINRSEDKHDAALIAAAPRVLAALKCAEMAMLGYTHRNDIIQAALNMARAAIVMAEGGEA